MRLFAVPMLALGALAGCAANLPSSTPAAPAAPVEAPAKKNPAPEFVVVIAGEPVPNLTPPQVLVERYPGSDGLEEDKFRADCDWKGGELVWTDKWIPWSEYPADGEFVCEGEDY